MKAALYARVSTTMQSEDGYSISAQINLLTDYCHKNSIEIHDIYSDEGISGQKEERAQFQRMINDASKKHFDIILVYKFDRFARKVELSQRVKRQLKLSGVNVISITEPVEDSPIGFFQEGIMELLGEYFVRDLAVRTKMGHVERASQGLHNGSVPYGYKIDHSNAAMMSVNTSQAETVKLIFDLYVTKGYGCTKIAKYLNYSEIKSAIGKVWYYFTINRILKNPKYAGYIEYDGNLHEGKHEPLISKETFQITQQYMKDRTWKREYRGVNYEKFTLLGLLRCGYCGKTMRVHKYTKLHYGYICNNATHADVYNCTHRKVYRADILESDVIKKLQNIINEGYLMPSSPTENKFVSDRKSKLQSRLIRLKEGYLNGIFTLEEYNKEKSTIDSEMQNAVIVPIEKNIFSWEEFKKAKTPTEKRNKLKEFIKDIDVTRDGVNINLL